MPSVSAIRNLYESRRGTPDKPNPRGRTAFVREFRHKLGLCDKFGNDYKDRAGNRILKESQADTSSFDISDLGLAMVGPRVMELFGSESKQLLAGFARHNMLVGGQHPEDNHALLEAAGVGVDVSAFADINAWTGASGGLVERKILEQFENPSLIGDELMPPEPTKINEGQKVIGVSRIGDLTQERQPGQAHQRAGFGERYVTLGKARENALAVDVFKETAFFDLTGQVMPTAESTGEWVSFRKEIEQIDAFLGITTQINQKYQFVYKGVPYNTYNAAPGAQIGGSTAPFFVNQISNELIDWSNVETAWLTFVRLLDPETNTRITPKPDRVVINPAKLATAGLIFGATESERRTAPQSSQGTTSDLHILRKPGNIVSQFFGDMKILWSALLEQRCTDAATGIPRPGLGLTQAAANKLWTLFQRGKFMKWMQHWPVTTTQAPANSYDMVDRGIVMSVFVNERGFPGVYSPWHAQQNTA